MINTFHTSFAPPPVPPRQAHRGPTMTVNTPLVKFLSVMVLLLFLMMFGGFLYVFHRLSTLHELSSGIDMLKKLQQCVKHIAEPEEMVHCMEYYNTDMSKGSQTGGKVAFLAGTGAPTIPKAEMVLLQQTSQSKLNQMDTLIWNRERSHMEKINLGISGALIIQFPGYYFIHSQVTFSKWHVKAPLKQVIWTRKTGQGERTENRDENLLVAYCSLHRNVSVPDLCTASQTGVFRLEKQQQLFVNVTDTSLVNAATSTFRLFKLRD
ncbi:CD40 ligand [Electrophorus electricus]|uniref:THD domain-containing protein n=1 Tax=Electrophorus electricus TaxID=8005 RepID=A0AAY5ENR0_ELEEL|nr:CD40 ligand [Electrophorus electricus]